MSQSFYFGTDLSYVNEMEDCGAYYMIQGDTLDVYEIMDQYGANLVRLRLWHHPTWYQALNSGQLYGDLADVRRSIQRAKDQGMEVLLDFHLSDNWADPGHQVAPAAWTEVLDDLPVLQDSLYDYMYKTLMSLGADDLLPDLVQIGNETNRGILLAQEVNDAGWTLDWQRNAALFNVAIQAVRDVEAELMSAIQIALHIANPSEAVWYYDQFELHGVTDFDIIGLSYYWPWHNHTLADVGEFIEGFREDFPDKRVMILETATPWTTAFADPAGNNLNTSPPGYSPPSPANQRRWLIDLTQTVISSGGSGLIYWEPAWISTTCVTQWGQGSHWENCTFFDFDMNLMTDGGIGWLGHTYDFSTGIADQASGETYTIYGLWDKMKITGGDAVGCGGRLMLEWLSMDGRVLHRESIVPEWVGGEIWIDAPAELRGLYGVRLMDERGCWSSALIFSE